MNKVMQSENGHFDQDWCGRLSLLNHRLETKIDGICNLSYTYFINPVNTFRTVEQIISTEEAR
jgi:hypothetical protein